MYIQHAYTELFGEHGQGEWARPPQLMDHSVRVCPLPVQFVDKGNGGNRVPPHLSVDGQRLALDPAHCTQHEDSPIQHPHGTLHLNGKVDMACKGQKHSKNQD